MVNKQVTKEILNQFVEDFYDLFMEGTLEFTNKYTIAYKEDVNSIDARSVIDLGLAYDWLWLVEIDGTPLVYIEVVDLVVQEHLLQHYVSKFEYSTEKSVEVIQAIKDQYLAEVVRFLQVLPEFVGEKDSLKPFGVASMVDEQYLRLDTQMVPIFHISLTELFKLLEGVQLRPIGIWEGQDYHKFREPKGEFEGFLEGVRVDELVSSMFLRGVYFKRKSVHS